MSEIHPSENRDLYIELELEELLEPQVFDEDPVLGELKGAPPFGLEEFIQFFEDRELDGSPSQGYAMVAESFAEDLRAMIEHLKKIQESPDSPDPVLVIPVAIRRLSVADFRKSTDDEEWPLVKDTLLNSKLYDGNETAADRAFRGQIEYLLHTRVLGVDSDDSPRQRTLYSGRYYDRQNHTSRALYLLESKHRDDKGEYSKLFLRSHPPEDMVTPISTTENTELPHFYTHGETETLVLDLYQETLSEFPTAPIDESEIVKGWISRKAA